jgi:ABC-2 type transport system ATP-binding protein
MENVIEVTHLQKNYGKLIAVKDISFSVQKGEIFGLLGRNGAGKTTTVECLQGLRPFDQGIVSVLGLNPVTEAPELRKRIGCQLQEAALTDRVKVGSIELFASLNNSNIDWQVVTRLRLKKKQNPPLPHFPVASGSDFSSLWRWSITLKWFFLTK